MSGPVFAAQQRNDFVPYGSTRAPRLRRAWAGEQQSSEKTPARNAAVPLSALGLAKAKADPLFLSGGLLCVIKPAAHTNLRGCSPAMMAGHTPEEAGNGGSERVFLGGGAMALDSAFDAAAAGTGPSHTDPPTAAAPPFRVLPTLGGKLSEGVACFWGQNTSSY